MMRYTISHVQKLSADGLLVAVACGTMSTVTDTTATTTETRDSAALPLGAYRTFDGFIASLREKDSLPPKIDRSIMVGKSGSDMAFLLATLRFFDLVDTSGAVRPELARLVGARPDERPVVLKEMVMKRYSNEVAVSLSNGTKDQLLEAIGKDFGVMGDTRRKAMTFLLHMMTAANMPKSEYFPDVRSGSGTTVRKAGAKRRAKPATPPTLEDRFNSSKAGDSYTVTLLGGGTVTVIVKESHFNLGVNPTDRTFVYCLVDALIGYAGANSQSIVAGLVSDEPDEPEEDS